MANEPLARDNARFKKLAPDKRPVLPAGLSEELLPPNIARAPISQLELFPEVTVEHESYSLDMMIESLRNQEKKE